MFVVIIFAFLFVNSCLSARGKEQLLSVQAVFRHGDRTPNAAYPTDPYKDIVFGDFGPVELTPIGMRRQLALGQWLRERYDDFLPRKYSAKDIRIVSNEIDRTLQSAYTCLAGLYPPQGNQVWDPNMPWQPIPVHTNPTLFDVLEKDCRPLGKYIEEQKQSVYIKTMNSVSKDVLAYLNEHTGNIYNSFLEIDYLFDVLYVESTLNLTLPEWTKKVYPYPLATYYNIWLSLYTSTDEITRISNGPLFQEIIDRFDTLTPKFLIYSGHETNILNIINILAPNHPKFCPEFSSTILLELWNIDNAKYVKTYLKRNDNIELINVEGCGTICSYHIFRKIFKRVSMTWQDKNRFCGIP